MLMLTTGAILLALSGCSLGSERPQGPVPVPGTGPAPIPVAPTTLPGPELPTLPVIEPEPEPEPEVDLTACDPCVLLLEHEFDTLQNGQACELCGEAVPAVCDGWPEPEPVSCETYDYLRNCMFARLGYPFETAEEWRTQFEAEPWYVSDPAFSWSAVDPLQTRNAKILRDLVAKRRCSR